MKAILRNGMILPKDPVPPDWGDGTELEVEKASTTDVPGKTDELDRWYAELERACAQMDPEDDRILKASVMAVRRDEKDRARREAGLE
jgi:hypothetical protein